MLDGVHEQAAEGFNVGVPMVHGMDVLVQPLSPDVEHPDGRSKCGRFGILALSLLGGWSPTAGIHLPPPPPYRTIGVVVYP
jgi:hypothetical protein